jgi:hypothetical protein
MDGRENKARKDLAQAASLIRVLAEDRPYDLQAAWQTALNFGEKWREAIDKSLRQKPDIASFAGRSVVNQPHVVLEYLE